MHVAKNGQNTPCNDVVGMNTYVKTEMCHTQPYTNTQPPSIGTVRAGLNLHAKVENSSTLHAHTLCPLWVLHLSTKHLRTCPDLHVVQLYEFDDTTKGGN